jgi:hypothetical protein
MINLLVIIVPFIIHWHVEPPMATVYQVQPATAQVQVTLDAGYLQLANYNPQQ